MNENEYKIKKEPNLIGEFKTKSTGKMWTEESGY